MFLNCLFFDLTVIDLMSIVHIWTKFGLKLQKNLKCGRPGGGGVVSDFVHPRTRGGGGVKKGQILADVLYGWPLVRSFASLT